MNLDRKKFEGAIPSVFHPILDELLKFGFKPILVGGSIRDFFLTGSLGKDWDIELTHDTIAFDKNQWKDLGKNLSGLGKMSFLPYEIIRLEVDSYQFEFSPPRKEIFNSSNHHSNFEAEFDYKLPFEKAVLRRDFTLNSMGVRFLSKKEWEFLDPLEGLRHLREQILHPAGRDFSKDPVRFIRALRFAQKYSLVFSGELEALLLSMKVESITPGYIWSEMQKSGDPVRFLGRLINETTLHPELKLPLGIKDISKIEEIKKVNMDPSRHEAWMIALEWVGLSCESWQTFFGRSSDTGRKIGRWAHSSRFFQKILPEAFHGEFEEIRDTENFEKLFDWYFSTKQILQKNPELPILKMIEEFLPDWVHLFKFEAPKDVKHIDPPFRAKYQVWNLCQRL